MKPFHIISQVIGNLVLLYSIHQPTLPIKFLKIEPYGLNIRILYYDFLSSNLGVLNKTATVFGIRSLIHCSLMCLINFDFRCNVFSYSSQEESCFLFPTLKTSSRNLSNLFASIPGSLVLNTYFCKILVVSVK